MPDVDSAITQLGLLQNKIKASKKRLADKEWLPVCKQVCAAFRGATSEQRVDIQIALEGRETQLSLFVNYLNRMSDTALKAARKDNQKVAIPALEEALTADAIIDGRYNVDTLQRLHKQLEDAVAETHYDMEAFLRKLATPVSIYLDHAYMLHRQGNRSQAIRVLGRAVQLDHSLQKQEQIADFAAALTGQSPKGALMTLEDAYLRNLFIEELENPSYSRKTVEARQISQQEPPPARRKGISAGVVVAILVVLVIVGIAGYWLIFLR
jgi:hypothetical protein